MPLRKKLVDDWGFITQNKEVRIFPSTPMKQLIIDNHPVSQLVPLPRTPTAAAIFEEFLKAHPGLDLASKQIVEGTISTVSFPSTFLLLPESRSIEKLFR